MHHHFANYEVMNARQPFIYCSSFFQKIRRRAKTGEELEFIWGFKQNLSGKLCVTIYSFVIDFEVSDDGTIVGF